MTPQPPPGQGPIDPRGAFSPPPPPMNAPPPIPPSGMPPVHGQPMPSGYFAPPGPPQQIVVQTAPPSRSFTRAIFTTLATTIFGVSLALNLYLLLWSGLTSGASTPSSRQTVITEGDLKEKVGVIPLKGVISSASYKKFDEMIKLAESDADLKALVIDIDTPGGEVTASDQIYNRVLRFKKKMTETGRTVPVVATIGALGTSGGYYVACSTDRIFTEPTGLTGNIGVLLPRFNISKLAEKYGIEETTTVSTGATYKNAGSMFKKETPEESAYIQKITDDAFTKFKNVVTAGRGNRLTVPLATAADGRAFFAADAKTMGLIDDVGTAEDAYEFAWKKAGLTKPHIVRYEAVPSLMSAFFGGEARADGVSPAVQFDGKSLSIGTEAIGDLMTPRLLYLWRGQ